jgi:hypothetical protein
MCACGCFLALAIIAGLVYCFIHALWLPAALIVILAAVFSWLGGKAAGWRPK